MDEIHDIIENFFLEGGENITQLAYLIDKHVNEQRLEAGQHEPCVMWRDVHKEMPNIKHVEKRTQFLLKGAYGTPGRLGATCYIVSRLDEAAYSVGDEIVFELPVGFIPAYWANIDT